MGMQEVQSVIAIDPGNQLSGVSVISLVNPSIIGFVESNETIFEKVKTFISENTIIVMEDIKPYSLRLSEQVIGTCKVIGMLEYRFSKELNARYRLLPRSAVKEWVFNAFPAVCLPRIEKKIKLLHERQIRKGKRGYVNKDGEMRKPSFVFVDDRIVIAAMKEHWAIPTPKVGEKTKYGLSTHSWQALALGSYFIANELTTFKGIMKFIEENGSVL